MSAAQPLCFQVTPAWRDYVASIVGSQLFAGPRKWLLPGALLLMLVVFGLTEPVADAIQFTLVWALATLLLGAIAVGFSARRLAKAQGAISYSLTPERFIVESGLGKLQTDWSVWKEAQEFGGVIIIRNKYGAFNTIPKRQLSDDAVRSLQSLLSAVLNERVHFMERHR